MNNFLKNLYFRIWLNSWKAFSASCWLWKHLPHKTLSRCLKKVVGAWQEVRWIWRMRQNICTNLISPLSGISDGTWLVFAKEQNMDLLQGRGKSCFFLLGLKHTHFPTHTKIKVRKSKCFLLMNLPHTFLGELVRGKSGLRWILSSG